MRAIGRRRPRRPEDADQAVAVVVLTASRSEVLLHKRRDFPVWDLPGGQLDPGESASQAAVREVLEETGFRVSLDERVAEFWRPQDPRGGTLVHVFRATVIGGRGIGSGPETTAVRWFEVASLPFTLYRLSRECIESAVAGAGRVTRRTQRVPRWLALAVRGTFLARRLRELSGFRRT